MEAATVRAEVRPLRRPGLLKVGRWLLNQSLNLYAALALSYDRDFGRFAQVRHRLPG